MYLPSVLKAKEILLLLDVVVLWVWIDWPNICITRHDSFLIIMIMLE